jgi:hypothetical protein
MAEFWLPFIHQVMKRPAPVAKESKDDPFSVLPR